MWPDILTRLLYKPVQYARKPSNNRIFCADNKSTCWQWVENMVNTSFPVVNVLTTKQYPSSHCVNHEARFATKLNYWIDCVHHAVVIHRVWNRCMNISYMVVEVTCIAFMGLPTSLADIYMLWGQIVPYSLLHTNAFGNQSSTCQSRCSLFFTEILYNCYCLLSACTRTHTHTHTYTHYRQTDIDIYIPVLLVWWGKSSKYRWVTGATGGLGVEDGVANW